MLPGGKLSDTRNLMFSIVNYKQNCIKLHFISLAHYAPSGNILQVRQFSTSDKLDSCKVAAQVTVLKFEKLKAAAFASCFISYYLILFLIKLFHPHIKAFQYCTLNSICKSHKAALFLYLHEVQISREVCLFESYLFDEENFP